MLALLVMGAIYHYYNNQAIWMSISQHDKLVSMITPWNHSIIHLAMDKYFQVFWNLYLKIKYLVSLLNTNRHGITEPFLS